MKNSFTLALLLLFSFLTAQNNFDYQVQLTPITVPNLPGLHSYAFGQNAGKWLIIGGRLDGIHARQPFNAFPSSNNNTTIYVVDINTLQLWSASLSTLAVGLQEQLQSTNMNFHQDGDTLYIIGGYGFSATANNHITHNKLTSINVPNLINAIVTGSPIAGHFKQITNENFAITGGQLGKIGSNFYLVGGHRFDGRYNPMNNPTFTQTYANGFKKFTIDNSGTQLSVSNIETVTDAIHLRRRDYNLVPQVFPDGTEGYTVSSGVFQINANLPFLYPVDIKSTGHTPQTGFNQYLSNYHSAKVGLYDAINNRMHALFFGGISQYYYNGSALIQDNNVPFVKTISRVTRLANGTLTEYQLPVELPSLKGAGAEFIPNTTLPQYTNEVIKLNEISANEFVIGHIYGGIAAPSANPFVGNLSNTTTADNIIYEVKLIKTEILGVHTIDGKNPFSFEVLSNPAKNGTVKIEFDLPYLTGIDYFISTTEGKIIDDGEISASKIGKNTMDFELTSSDAQMLIVTFIFDQKFYVSRKVILK